MKLGIVGYGYWGPNLLRNFNGIDGVDVKFVCDMRDDRLDIVKKQYPSVRVTKNFDDLLASDIDAVAISTPVDTHYPLAKKAIENGKHVFIEKPMTSTVEHAEDLVASAAKKGVVLMVDHTFIYTGAVTKIKELIDSGALGELLYFDSIRVNLGLFQHDVNVVWDLAPHDLAIMDYLVGGLERGSVNAVGQAHYGDSKIENVAYVTVNYPDRKIIAHINVNWLSPVKIRQILIGGTKKMIVYNDMETVEKVKVFDKGVSIESGDKEAVYKTLIQYRTGDILSPKIDQREALAVECRHFMDCVKNGKKPLTDGNAGLRVVRILAAAEKSIKNGGSRIPL